MMPADFASWFAPGAWVTSDVKSRLCGSRLTCSARMFVDLPLCLTSTIGDSAVTVTFSVTLASERLKSTDLIEPSLTSTFDTLPSLKPASVAVTSYSPGRTEGKRKWPLPSEVAESTPLPPLLASTVTPGRTAPDASFTTPSIVPRCSWARAGPANSVIASNAAKTPLRINPSSWCLLVEPGVAAGTATHKPSRPPGPVGIYAHGVPGPVLE